MIETVWNKMQLVAADICNNNPVTLEENKTLYDARNVLLKYNISRVIILKGRQNKKPAGIVTEKDIVRFLHAEFPRRSLDEIRLDEIIANQQLITVEGGTNVGDCAKLMLNNDISSLVIVKANDDDNSVLSGIITKSDLLDAYARSFGGDVAINEYMTKKVLTVKPDESVHIVLLIMADGNVSRVIVVGDNNSKPVGIITSHDLLPASTLLIADKSKPPLSQYRTKGKEIEMNENTGSTAANTGGLPFGMKRILLAQDIMKFNPIMVTDYSNLVDAALIMRGNRISGLPVVDSNDKLVGIITKTDIIRAIADDRQ
ncbi:MAG TPA: CBS domain-containing protein [Nitrososphaeraceae archaeon]|nr:CBS domain-containing protein [Nitrososphaeraceae archaeon]